MIPGQFDYVRPAGLHEALRILTEREGEAKVLSGGYSLLPLSSSGSPSRALLVDIRDIDGLDAIVETDDELRIGARATHRRILEDPTVRARFPILVDAAQRDRRPPGPQLGHDRRVVRPRRSVVRLAGRPAGHPGVARLPEPAPASGSSPPGTSSSTRSRRRSSRPSS